MFNKKSMSHFYLADDSPSDTLFTPVTDGPEDARPWASAVAEETPGLRRRKNVRGYYINSDEERSGESDCCFTEEETEESKTCKLWEPPMSCDKQSTFQPDSLEIRTSIHTPITVSVIFPSLLPSSYVGDNVSVTSGASFASSTFDTLTYHRELREAQVDSDFDRVLARLISEWYYTGASVSMVSHSLPF